jgi:hypothetical protein
MPESRMRASTEAYAMTGTWDWILIYSLLFLLSGMLVGFENKTDQRRRDRFHRRH